MTMLERWEADAAAAWPRIRWPKIVPIDAAAALAASEEKYSMTGWPKQGACAACGARAVMTVGTWESGTYECRGTPAPDSNSAYGSDACYAVFDVPRA